MASLLNGEKERVPPSPGSSQEQLRRGVAQIPSIGTWSLPSWLCGVLRIPLEMKLLAANLMITAVAVLLLFGPVRFESDRLMDAIFVATALGAGSLVNFCLVRLALRPVRSLTQVAWLVSEGLLGARVPSSTTADRQLTQLSLTINGLLDDLVNERARISKLSGEPVKHTLGVVRSRGAFVASYSRLSR